MLHSYAEETPAPVPPGGCYRLLPREPEWAAMTESEKKLKINRMRRKSRSGGGKQSGSHPQPSSFHLGPLVPSHGVPGQRSQRSAGDVTAAPSRYPSAPS